MCVTCTEVSEILQHQSIGWSEFLAIFVVKCAWEFGGMQR